MTFTDIPIFSIVTNGQVNDLIANLLMSNLEHFRVRSDAHGRLRCSFGASSVVGFEGHANAFKSVDRRREETKMATNHVPTRIQDLALLGRMMDVQTSRSERQLLHEDLLVLNFLQEKTS